LPGSTPSVAVVQSVHPALPNSVQSATHSLTLPIMSWTPQADLQLAREPVSSGPAAGAEPVTQVGAWSSAAPGSGVPAAASCHSRFVISRLLASRQACPAWNHVVHVEGGTPAIDAA